MILIRGYKGTNFIYLKKKPRPFPSDLRNPCMLIGCRSQEANRQWQQSWA